MRISSEGRSGQETTIVMQYDLDGKNGKEIAGFDFYGDILIGGDRIYCYTVYGGEAGRISMYTLWDNKRVSLPNMNLTDYCIYKGTLYGLRETADEERHLTEIYALEYDKLDRRTME